MVAEYSVFNRSVFYVYDSKGKLVYQEVLPETCSAIMASPNGLSGTESILICGQGRVLKYSGSPQESR